MEQLPSANRSLQSKEKINSGAAFCGKYRVLAAFLISAAVLTAAFAASSIWRTTESGAAFFEKIAGFFDRDDETSPPTKEQPSVPPVQEDAPPSASPPISENVVRIVSRDLSHAELGATYFLNETPYQPDVEALLNAPPSLAFDKNSDKPLVLIVQTHTSESYLPSREEVFSGDVSDMTYSKDRDRNMLTLGRELADLLNGKGISTLHCTVDHTGDGGSVQGAYERSAESVKGYLKQYPSIQLVIDLHRDAVLTSEGAYVRSAARGDEQTAQVMAVVGSDTNGTACNWEGNFALAMTLRQKLNRSCEGIARPVYLRRSSFNQELAPYSLLLEIGTGANTLEEAKRTVQRVGDALAEMIRFN